MERGGGVKEKKPPYTSSKGPTVLNRRGHTDGAPIVGQSTRTGQELKKKIREPWARY